MIPVDLSLPAAIVPGVKFKNCLMDFFHCSRSACDCTRIRVFIFLSAIRAEATTVFPKPVPAQRIPVSDFSIFASAIFCSS